MAVVISTNELEKRIEEAYTLLESCRVCPRACGVNRLKDDKLGFCRSGLNPVIASVSPHHGEDTPLPGTKGSGTLFFANCNLRWVYCQNSPISQLAPWPGAHRPAVRIGCRVRPRPGRPRSRARALAGRHLLRPWYPVTDRAGPVRFRRELERSDIRKVLDVQLNVLPVDAQVGMAGAGLAIVNPPWLLDERLKELLPALHRLLSPDGAGSTHVQWLVPE